MSNSIVALRYHLAFHVAFKLQAATKLTGQHATGQCSFGINHGSTLNVQLNRLIVN